MRGAIAATALALAAASSSTVPAGAVLSISNVTVRVSAPESSPGPFPVEVTIRNAGTVSQPSGSKATISAARGTISALPTGCAADGDKAVCTAGFLRPGWSKTFTVTVSPAPTATSVFTSATVRAARGEFNVPPADDGDFDGKRTEIPYAVSLELTNVPTTVRFGDDTLLSAAVTNGGRAQNVTLVVATGNVHDDAQTNLPAECGVSEDQTTVMCEAAFAAGEQKSFDIAVKSPPSGESFVSSATATGAVGGAASDSVTTQLFEEAEAFVPEGTSLTSQGEETETTFTVPEGSAPGLTLKLSEVEIDYTCGSEPCHTRAAEALFPNEGTYSGNDPAHPFVWDITYNVDQYCDESGETCLFNPIFYVPSGSDTAVSMPKCSTFTHTGPPAQPVLDHVDQVCLNFVSWTPTSATYQVALLRDIVIPILSGLGGRR